MENIIFCFSGTGNSLAVARDVAEKHGVLEKKVFQTLKDYDNTSIVDKITCETLVMDGTAEIIPGQAQHFFDALKCPKVLHAI